jgi:hypothetical protein
MRIFRNSVEKIQIWLKSDKNDQYFTLIPMYLYDSKGKGLPQQAEVAQGILGRLRPRIFLTFGTTRVVGRQPYAPAAFTPGEIPATHF